LAALNIATHGAIAKAIQQGDLESKAGGTLLLSATDAWAKLGLKAERLLLVSSGDEPKSSKTKASALSFSKWMQAGLKVLTATSAKNALWVFEDLSSSDGLTQARLLVQLARDHVYKFGVRHAQFKTKPSEIAAKLVQLTIATNAKNNKELQKAVAEGNAIANGMDLTKDLGNLPQIFARQAI